MNKWLKQRAFKNESEGGTRTYVVCQGHKVVAYYSLANGCIAHTSAPGKIKRNMPDPIPVMVLARLAVDLNHQGQGIGTSLIQDAAKRTLKASEIAGIRAIVAHALNDQAKAFYESCGFQPSPIKPLTVMVTLKDIKTNLSI